MYKTSAGKDIDLSKAMEIAAGGEGRILEHPVLKNKVVKIYHAPRPGSFAKHLEILSTLGGSFVKPSDIYFNGRGQVCGFDMPYVNFNDYFLFNNLFNKGFCNQHGIDKTFKVKLLNEIKKSVEELHSKGIIIGDFNQYNIFFSKQASPLFVDVDSYATAESKHNGVLLDDIRDWTTLNINNETDAWAYDILSFWSTTFCHPFKWVVPGNTETIDQRIKNHRSYLTKIPGIKIPVLYEPPTGEVYKQFSDIFGGRRYMINFGGTHVPVSTVIKQAVVSTSLDIRELYTGVLKVNAAKKYVAVRVNGKWILLDTSISKNTRQVEEVLCDELYPSDDKYSYSIGNSLISYDKKRYDFSKPTFYYNDGHVLVFDYATDRQWNFDIVNQIAGIAHTFTPIFTKSIIIRNAPIQNFGGKKYLNLPMSNTYTLVEVPTGTKNGYYYGKMIGIEEKSKNQVRYFIQKLGAIDRLELDFFPFFTVKGDLLFVPENGHIQVYKNLSLVSNLDVSICTRDSKLYNTEAGILLLEAGILYLLNTKS